MKPRPKRDLVLQVCRQEVETGRLENGKTLTLFRRELPPLLTLPAWLDRPSAEDRGATPMVLVPTPIPMPTAGDIERAGMLGGGPGSAPGERRCIERVEFMIFVAGPSIVDSFSRAARRRRASTASYPM